MKVHASIAGVPRSPGRVCGHASLSRGLAASQPSEAHYGEMTPDPTPKNCLKEHGHFWCPCMENGFLGQYACCNIADGPGGNPARYRCDCSDPGRPCQFI